MLAFERSIDIALSREIPEAEPRKLQVIPLTSTESRVAERGLALHLDILYRGVQKKSNSDRALQAAFDFLDMDMDSIRGRMRQFSETLDPDKPETVNSRLRAAIAISQLINGQFSHMSQFWPTGNQRDEQLLDTFSDVITDENFLDLQLWGHEQSIRNGIFWRHQLESVRQDPYVEALREAIDESDHYLFEV